MEAIIKMAVAQTVLDAVELLHALYPKADDAEKKRIEEMVRRLTTMVAAI